MPTTPAKANLPASRAAPALAGPLEGTADGVVLDVSEAEGSEVVGWVMPPVGWMTVLVLLMVDTVVCMRESVTVLVRCAVSVQVVVMVVRLVSVTVVMLGAALTLVVSARARAGRTATRAVEKRIVMVIAVGSWCRLCSCRYSSSKIGGMTEAR